MGRRLGPVQRIVLGGTVLNALRRLGLAVGRLPSGPRCSLTDVAGVRVGHCTVVRDDGPQAVRTGVTAVLPPGDPYADMLPVGLFVLHGHGKAVGLWQVAHLGTLETPIILTNTWATFCCADALLGWTSRRHPAARSVNPVVLECNDGLLSAIEQRPVREEDALAALEAAGCQVEEGCVGAGTGMVAFELKSGVGTASRVAAGWTVGALVLPNMGRREDLRFLGRPLDLSHVPRLRRQAAGSVIVLLATDAPLLPEQLSRLARRGALGLARTGAPADPGSGDFLVAFSTAYRVPRGGDRVAGQFVADRSAAMGDLYRAAAEATEEAVLSALLAARTLTGRDGRTAFALPAEALPAPGPAD
ncbi:MAG: P1 family peptidase [Candidatus Bipolaricaulaceae bacterium]